MASEKFHEPLIDALAFAFHIGGVHQKLGTAVRQLPNANGIDKQIGLVLPAIHGNDPPICLRTAAQVDDEALPADFCHELIQSFGQKSTI